MGRIETESEVPYPPPVQPQPQPPQPQGHAYNYPPPYSPQPQPQPQPAAFIYPQPQNNNVVQNIPPQYQQNSPNVGAVLLQSNGAATGMPVQMASTGIMPVQFNVPMASPAPIKVVPTGSWTTGLFDCMDDPTNALITALFPCVTFGQIADVMDNGHTTCATSGIIYAVAPCLVSRPYRTKLRRRFGLVEAPAADWIVHTIFEPCALCQEFRELNNRGINPTLGHHGNLNKQQSSPMNMMVPPSNQMMQ